MNTKLRFAPPGPNGEILAEITQRTLLGIYLLRPSERLNQLIVGVIAKAQQSFPVKIVALSVLSNHYHVLVTCKNHKQLSGFMNFFSSNLAREAGRLHKWRGKLWARRFSCTPITHEEKIQVARLQYLLGQGCKEGLVSSPRQWPGLNGVRELLSGRPLKGIWVDRTGLYKARQKKNGHKVRAIDFEEHLTVELVPLPCWAHLTPAQYQAQIRALVDTLERQTLERHRLAGSRPVGRRWLLRQSPLHRPAALEPTPAPRVHAATRASRQAFLEAYRLFAAAFRQAAEKLKKGDRTARFPQGSFPPALPFVEARPASKLN